MSLWLRQERERKDLFSIGVSFLAALLLLDLVGSLVVTFVWLGGCGGQSGDGERDGGADADRDDGGADGDGGPAALGWGAVEDVSGTLGLSDVRYQWGRSLAVGDDGVVHAVWREVSGVQDGLDLAGVVYRRREGDGWGPVQALSETLPGTGHPKVVLAGSRVLVVWHRHDGSGEDAILLATSEAGGAAGSFGAPRTLLSDVVVTSRNPLAAYSTTPSITADGGFLHLVWSDERLVGSCGAEVSEIYLLSSPDLGATWSAPLRVSSPDCRSSWTPAVSARGGVVHVAWTDERYHGTDCGLSGGACKEEELYRRLAGDGSTPDPQEVRLTHDEPGEEAESWGPSIVAWDGHVQVVWYDRGGGPDFEVYHLGSEDGGAHWDAAPGRLSASAPGCRSACPTVAAEGRAVHVVWFEICGETSSTVRHRWSSDLGAAWSPVSTVSPSAGAFAVHPHVAVHDGRAHVLWSDNGDGEVYYAASR